jgi:hypothetical protein
MAGVLLQITAATPVSPSGRAAGIGSGGGAARLGERRMARCSRSGSARAVPFSLVLRWAGQAHVIPASAPNPFGSCNRDQKFIFNRVTGRVA